MTLSTYSGEASAPPTDMIENIAITMHACEPALAVLDATSNGSMAWDDLTDECRTDYREAAKRILLAVRIPTETMSEAGSIASDKGNDAVATWQAMVDAALADA